MSARFEIPEEQEAWHPADPADANTCWEWIQDVLAKIGLAVVVIEVSKVNPTAYCWPALGLALSAKLNAANLGELDAFKAGEPPRLFFLVPTNRIAEGLQKLKAELIALNLLEYVRLGFADADVKVWRTVHPLLTEKQ